MTEPGATRALSLHQLVALDLPVTELVQTAARLGCRHVCIFTQDPRAGVPFPVIGEEHMRDLSRVMAGSGVSALCVTSFLAAPDTDVRDYEAALDRGARLGASVANMRIADDDEGRAAQTFAAFAALCRTFDLNPCIEFVGFDDPDTVPRVIRIIEAAGDGALTVDALHVARSGTRLDYLRALDPAMIGYVQLCDGPLRGTLEHYPYEGFFDRMAPGEGEFPLAALIEAMPAHLPISLEVPGQSARNAGMTAKDWARHVVETAKGVLDVSAR